MGELSHYETPGIAGDYGGRHINCGVQNFAFYLLAQGGSGNNDGNPYQVKGIGIKAAAAVAMRADMFYLTSTATYLEARKAWISAAKDLDYSVKSVEAAWNAVGVPPPTLIAIAYDTSLGQNAIATVHPSSGASVVLNNFAFDTGFWQPLTFAVDLNLRRAYAMSSGNSLYTFDTDTGGILATVATANLQAAKVRKDGKLLGIAYNNVTEQNEIRAVTPATGASRLLNSFAFDTGFWAPFTFAVNPELNRAYAMSSGNTLYTINANTGAILGTVATGSLQAAKVRKDGKLLGIAYNEVTKQNEIRVVTPATGASVLLNSFVFDTGYWAPATFTVNVELNRAHAMSSGKTLYTFDAGTGAVLSTVPIGIAAQVLGR